MTETNTNNGKDPNTLADCETGFDLADELEQRPGIEIDNPYTNQWRVALTVNPASKATFERKSLPGQWEIRRVTALADGTGRLSITFVDTAIYDD